ncbi:MAG: methyltransferase domain-containing protein [Planctomyces sp.]|nr:methyltransferase domain-containing protein [Planctomyces sp.]
MSSEAVAVRPIPSLHARFWNKALSGLPAASPRRVLEVGCGRGESLALLISRGVDAYGFDLGAAAGPLLAPKSQFAFGSLCSAMTFPQHHFDLVVVRPNPAFRGELATAEHHVATANLLSCLKPGGRMIIVEPRQGRDDASAADWAARWDRHLEAFTAQRRVHPYADGLGWWLSLGFLKKTPRLDLQLISVTIPDAPVTRLEWHRQARTAVLPRTRQPRRKAA